VKFFKKIKNGLVYLSVRGAYRLFNILPRRTCQKLGGWIGEMIYAFSEKDKQTAHRTLNLVYGDQLTTLAKEEIIKSFFVNSGKNLADVVRFRKYYHKQLRTLIDIEGREYFDAAYQRGKGIIAVTGHIGNFELLAAYFSGEGYKVAVIGREMYDKRLDKMLVGNRSAMGIINVDTNESPRRLLKLLKEGYAIGVLIDTDSWRVRSEFIPAFGKKSRTPVGQSILGLKTGAAFVPMACVREGGRYKIIVREEIIPERSDNFDDDVYNITARCTTALDEIIDAHRDQWIWIHNRWRTRPPEEKGLENKPAEADN
jgi:KDO2-lipid IV(A) lauroyltransferase